MDKPLNGSLRVWWIPQVPGKAFRVPVKSTDEARLLLSALADYDIFQLNQRIKPDFANMGGLEVWDEECPDDKGDCWIEWSNEFGENIDEVA